MAGAQCNGVSSRPVPWRSLASKIREHRATPALDPEQQPVESQGDLTLKWYMPSETQTSSGLFDDNLPLRASLPQTAAWPERQLHRFAGLLAALLVITGLLLGWRAWRVEEQEQHQQLRSVLEISAQAVDRSLQGLLGALAGLAGEVATEDGLPLDPQAVQSRLRRFKAVLPDLVGISLVQIDGQVLATSVAITNLPSYGALPSFIAFRQGLADGTALAVGQPLLGPLAGQWVVPLRHVIRDRQGRPVLVLSAGLPVSYLHGFWQGAPLVAKAAVGMIGDDGFLRGRHPLPPGARMEDVFGDTRTGDGLPPPALAAGAVLEARDPVDNRDVILAAKRLPHVPLTMFATLPLDELRAAWWGRIWDLWAVLLAFGLISAMTYGGAIRQLRRWHDERNQSDAIVRDREVHYRKLFETSLDAVCLTRPDGRILAANPAACRMFGLSEAEIIARGRKGIIDASDARIHAQVALRTRTGYSYGEVTAIRGDGTRFDVMASSVIYTDMAGEPMASVVMHDTAAEHRAEVALRDKAVAEKLSRAKSEFIASMSHELRTPLNAVLGFGELLLNDHQRPLPAQQHRYADQIVRAGRHLLQLINDLLDLARIEAGRVKITPADFELNPVLDDAVRNVAALAQASGVVLEPTAQLQPAVVVHADATRVMQVMLNLLSNAIKYNVQQGQVRVHTTRADGQVRVHVVDTGVGMSPEQLAGLFQPFNRLGRDGSGVEGTGLGLVITRSLIEAMGGTLSVSSEPGVGTAFVMALPLAGGAAPR
jgi:PAS domain S-box-containing protein